MKKSWYDSGFPHKNNEPTVDNCINCRFSYGGGGWIRTTVGIASRFTVCPLWPLGNSPIWTFWNSFSRLSNQNPAKRFWFEEEEDSGAQFSRPRGNGAQRTTSDDGAGGRTRTPDLLITNQLLYQLSYTSVSTLDYYTTKKQTRQPFFAKFLKFFVDFTLHILYNRFIK